MMSIYIWWFFLFCIHYIQSHAFVCILSLGRMHRHSNSIDSVSGIPWISSDPYTYIQIHVCCKYVLRWPWTFFSKFSDHITATDQIPQKNSRTPFLAEKLLRDVIRLTLNCLTQHVYCLHSVRAMRASRSQMVSIQSAWINVSIAYHLNRSPSMNCGTANTHGLHNFYLFTWYYCSQSILVSIDLLSGSLNGKVFREGRLWIWSFLPNKLKL